MNAQEILSGANRLTFSKFEDINLSLLTKISKEVTKLFGDFEVVSNKQIRGKKELNIKAGGFTYIGKGEFSSIVIHFKEHNVYINERRLYIPKFPNGSCVDYQGSEFFEVKPKGKGFADVEELC
jgi:hypothetical protein